MVVTMPSPTRAMMVSSLAPPTKRSRLVRTVTRARTFTWMPSLATPSMVVRPEAGFGQSMTLGSTEVRRLRRRFAGALGGEVDGAGAVPIEVMPAFCAAMSAWMVGMTLPPARKWASMSSIGMSMPAFFAVMRASTTMP
jgi:hypothetical protein